MVATSSAVDPDSQFPADAGPTGALPTEAGLPTTELLAAADVEPPRRPAGSVPPFESRNLVVLTLYSVCLRTAWIFKTESVVVPAFFDALAAGAGNEGAVTRSFLPILNRVGQSVPQVFLSDRLRASPRKRWFLLRSTLSMMIMFGVWTVVAGVLSSLTDDEGHTVTGTQITLVGMVLPWVALVCYMLFFASNGTNQLAFGVCQGKLLRPERRGRLLSWSTILGSIMACVAAAILLPPLLRMGPTGFVWIFLITATGFGVASFVLLFLREQRDQPMQARPAHHALFQTWRAVKRDPRLRAVGTVAALVILAQNIFPHYQALGRAAGLARPVDMMLWVVIQNIGTGVFGVIVGSIADRWGNALALRVSTPLVAATPILALLTADRTIFYGWGYLLVFFLLGIMPIVLRTLVNYTLELAPRSKHPRYVATLQVMQAVPLVFSVPFGLIAERLGFMPIFVGTAVAVGIGAAASFLLVEPRQ